MKPCSQTTAFRSCFVLLLGMPSFIFTALAHGQSDPCGANAREVRRTENSTSVTLGCECNEGYEVSGEACVPMRKLDPPAPPARTGDTVVNLAINPQLAKIDRIELREIEARIARLHKELALLSKRDEEAEKDLKGLHAEMVEEDHEIDWQAFLFATAGLGEVLNQVGSTYVEEAESIQSSTTWGEIPIEKAALQKMLVTSRGQDAVALKESIDALDMVERAHNLKKTVELGNMLKEAMVVQSEETNFLSTLNPRTADAIYANSVILGRLAIIFGKGVVEKSSVYASFAMPLLETGAVYLYMREDQAQMDQLSGHFVDRQKMRLKIDSQLGELENKQQTLQWAIQRADPQAK
jgi:hypothetical protein